MATFGTGVGMAVGSFIPGIGTAAGGIVGGAIGSVAGGYVSASAYDLYVKQKVLDAVEGGLAWVFDGDELGKAMQAREAHLRTVAALDLKPEWERFHMVSEGFGAAGIELVNPPTIFYEAGTPGVGDVAPVLDSGDYLAGASKLLTGDLVWTIENGVASASQRFDQEPSTIDYVWKGRVSPNRIDGTFDTFFVSKNKQCGNRIREHAASSSPSM